MTTSLVYYTIAYLAGVESSCGVYWCRVCTSWLQGFLYILVGQFLHLDVFISRHALFDMDDISSNVQLTSHFTSKAILTAAFLSTLLIKERSRDERGFLIKYSLNTWEDEAVLAQYFIGPFYSELTLNSNELNGVVFERELCLNFPSFFYG